jgi:hypothetical protein
MWQRSWREVEVKETNTKPTETICPAFSGTGYPIVMQPVRSGRKIYPAPLRANRRLGYRLFRSAAVIIQKFEVIV